MSPRESPSPIEPCDIESLPAALSDSIVDLAQAGAVLGAKLHPRTATSLADLRERTARQTLSALLTAGLLASETPKSDVFLRFSSDSAEFLFPRLFPAQTET
jgi:hypothetical protein